MPLELPVLNRRFTEAHAYRRRVGTSYALLPFRFIRLDESRCLLSNIAGEYAIATRANLDQFARHDLSSDDPLYLELKSKHFLIDADSDVAVDLLAAQYRTRQSLLAYATGLFLFVVTLRCDHTCGYCQVSRQSEDRTAYDMRPEDAARAVAFMFESPSPYLKVEFQGGESLLNFDLIRYVVQLVEERNATEDRQVEFVIATNLAPVTDEMLSFCAEHRVLVSTSLDGPAELHNRNRPRPGRNSHALAVAGIERARSILGHDRVSALMTTTEASLTQPEAIVDEYVRLGFNSIFLRSISPYGFAVRTGHANRYQIEEWLAFYKRALAHIIEINRFGVPFREDYAAIILRKLLTPMPTGYVDLQSPAGMGLGCLVFNYDGAIYASDEGRMLAEMGDYTFRLGNLATGSYVAAMRSPAIMDTLAATMTEGMPMCSDCGFQPYCGSDPVFHHAVQGDPVGFKPTSPHCRKNMEAIRHLILLLEDDPDAATILRSWL